MLLRIFLISYRRFKEHFLFNSLNILGYSIGLAGIFLLTLIISNETSFDKFHQDYKNIYRLTTDFIINGQTVKYAVNSGIFAEVLSKEIPEISSSTAFLTITYQSFFIINDRTFKGDRGFYIDTDFFKVFDFKLLNGNFRHIDPNSIILTKKSALKYFGNINVEGKMIELKQGNIVNQLKVIAVIDNIPVNSSIQFDYLISGSTIGQLWFNLLKNTEANSFYIYFKTYNNVSIHKLQSVIDSAFSKYKMKGPGYDCLTPVQRLQNIHYDSNNQFELEPGGNPNFIKIYLYILIGLFLITTANVSNINSAGIIKQIKATGLKKIFGADQLILVSELMIGFAIQIAVSFFVASLLFVFIITQFDLSIFSIDLSSAIHFFNSETCYLLIISMYILTSIYPVYKVLSYKVVDSFKKITDKPSLNKVSFRYVLMTIQIVAVSVLLVFSMVIRKQIMFETKTNLGFDKDNLIEFHIPLLHLRLIRLKICWTTIHVLILLEVVQPDCLDREE